MASGGHCRCQPALPLSQTETIRCGIYVVLSAIDGLLLAESPTLPLSILPSFNSISWQNYTEFLRIIWKERRGGEILSKNLVKALQICRTCPILKNAKDWHKSCNKKSNASHPTEIRRIAANAGKLRLIFSVRRELKGLHRSHVQLVSLVHWRRRGAGMQLSVGLQPPETHKSLCLSPASINVSENVNH